MKRVLIITYYWPPSGGAGVTEMVEICKVSKEFQLGTYCFSL